MIDDFLNALRGHAEAMDNRAALARVGVVTSYNPVDHTAKVSYDDQGDNLSGWLPVTGQFSGQGGGAVLAPGPGAQVVVLFQGGDPNSGIIIGSLYNVQNQPPTTWTDPKNQSQASPAQPGEFLVVHPTAPVFIRLTASGFIIHGALYVSGDIIAGGNVYDSVGPLSALRTEYNGHVHPGVQAGAANTGATTSQAIPEPPPDTFGS